MWFAVNHSTECLLSIIDGLDHNEMSKNTATASPRWFVHTPSLSL